MSYVPRTASMRLSLPLAAGSILLRPQDVKLDFAKEQSQDIGIACFKARRSVGTKREYIPASFCESRAANIRKLLYLLSEMAEAKTANIWAKLRGGLKLLAYCDEHGEPCPLVSPGAAKDGLTAYASYLEERVRLGLLGPATAAEYKAQAQSLLEAFHEEDNLGQGLVLRVPPKTKNATEPAAEDRQARVLSVCSALFSGICELVLDKKPYPYKLVMPKYLGWPQDFVWMVPARKRFTVPGEPASSRSRAIDYAEGRLRTLAEVEPLFDYPWLARRALTDTEADWTAANTDFDHIRRWEAARQAASCFPLLFVAHVGLNAEQLCQLPWEADFEVSPERQGFRTVKLRAGGRQVSFEIQPSFLPLFRRYVALREYVLKGRDCPWLFFSCTRQDSIPTMLDRNFLSNIQGHLRLVDKDLPLLSARVWRACKSDWLLRNTDPATAALVLQTSLPTMLKHYSAGSKTTAMVEMSDYLNRVADKVLNATDSTPMQSGPVGGCLNYGHPSEVPGDIKDKPNCKNPEGCLFCSQYRVHADERDTRKLLSCRSCIQQTASFSKSAETFLDVFGPVVARIDSLLDEIRQRDGGADMVTHIENSVEDGDLDPYWARKMELLSNLGMLS